MTNLQQLLREIRNLKPVPAVTAQLIQVADDPGSSMEDIANVIQYDPVITAEILKTCNSAYFGLKHPAESIKDAVSMLGIDQVTELALMKSASGSLKDRQKGYGTQPGDLWRYSVACAVIAKKSASILGLADKNTLFTAALLKDIGKIILDTHVLKSSDMIDRLVADKGLSFREAEKKIFGIDHAELGALMLKMWKFSPRMVKIIRHHHLSDEKMIKDRETGIVYLSDCVCMMMGIGLGKDGLSYRFRQEVMKELGLSADDISLIIADFGVQMQQIEQLLNIV
jgi:putative nucleotidyltransferase with HDIG domain